MAKKAEDLTKHTMNFHSGDMEDIRDLVPDMHPTVVIRELIHEWVLRHKAAGKAKKLKMEEIKL